MDGLSYMLQPQASDSFILSKLTDDPASFLNDRMFFR